MDTPPIQYARASDGVSIAYASMGEGLPLLVVPGWISNVENEWSFAPRFEGFRTILMDKRGTGLSDRGLDDYSVAARVQDVEAIVEAEGLERLVLYGASEGGPIAIRYAADHPERVAGLMLYGTYARGDVVDPAVHQAILALARAEWGLASLTLVELFAPGATSDQVELWRRGQREGATQEDAVKLWEAVPKLDVADLLPSISCPALIIHSRGDRIIPFEHGRELAAAIPNARLVSLDTDRHWFGPGDPILSAFFGAQRTFLEELVERPDSTATPQGFQTILFTDLESSTALTQRLGDEGAQELLRGHNEAVRAALEEHGGREVKHTGDGIMASFPSAVAAVTAGLQMQRDLAGGEVRVRVGINAGEPIAEDHDLFGTAVQLAARITDRAEPGQVLVSDVVRQLCAGKTFAFTSAGEATLKGFDEPVALYEVRA
jgi:class 3 adenylate cyclase